MKKSLVFLLILCLIVAVGLVACKEKDTSSDDGKSTEQDVDISEYTEEIVDEKYLKAKLSEATSIYYKSTKDGRFGVDKAVFEYSVMPSDYLEVEYVQSNGNLYVDTGIPYSRDLVIDVKFGDYSTAPLSGSVFGTANGIFTLSRSDTNQIGFVASQTTSFVYSYFSQFKTYTVRCSEGAFAVNDNKTISVATPIDAGSGGNIFLFRGGDGYGSFKLYSFKITKGRKVIQNLVPCKNDLNEAGLYDLVSGQFYQGVGKKSGLSEIDTPVEVVDLPKGYTQLAYLKSTGTQYIDTGIMPDNTISLGADYMYESVANGDAFVGGAGSPAGYLEIFAWDGYLKQGYGNIFSGDALQVNTRMVSFIAQGNMYQKIGRPSSYTNFSEYTLINTMTSDGFNIDASITVFAINRTLCEDQDILIGKGVKIYRFMIYDGWTAVRDLIPAQRESDGEVGMYDLVGDVFYTNAGTGNFEYHEKYTVSTTLVASSGDLPERYTELEYVESDGTQYVETDLDSTRAHKINSKHMPLATASVVYSSKDGYAPLLSGSYIRCLSENVQADYQFEIGKEYEVSNSIDGVTVNGQSVEFMPNPGNLHIGPLCLFKYFKLSPSEDFGHLRLYYLRVFDEEDALIMDLVPCEDKYTGAVGLYDKVSSKLFTSATDSPLIPSEAKTNKVSGYTMVDYIESDGTQYMDTGFVAVGGMTVDSLVSDVSNSHYIIGSHSTSEPYGRNGVSRLSDGRWELGYGDFCPQEPYSQTADVYRIRFSTVVGNAYLYVNDTLLTENYEQTAISTDSVYLFTNTYGLEVYPETPACACKFYYARIYDAEDSLVRDYIPCIRDSDGVAGLYDYVTNTFYESDSTPFIAGDVKGNSIGDRSNTIYYEEIEFITLTGLECVDSGIYVTSGLTVEADVMPLAEDMPLFGAKSNDGASFGIRIESGGLTYAGGEYSFASGEDIYARRVITYGGGALYIDGFKVADTQSEEVYRNLYLGAINNVSTLTGALFTGRVYGFKVYEDGVLIRDYVPTLRKYDGVQGFFEKVTGVFCKLRSKVITFEVGDVVGHSFDEGTVVQELSEKQDGDILYTCTICGKQIHKYTDSYAYHVHFSYDEGVDYIKVYKGYDFSSGEISDDAYTRNLGSNNFSRVNGGVYVEIVLKPGYKISKIDGGGVMEENLEGMIYRFSQVTCDTEVIIATTR